MCVVTFDWEENDAKRKVEEFKKTKATVWAVVELTDACNFNCIWCYASAHNIRTPVHMEIRKAKKLLHFLSVSGIKQITCSGGEPTMYPYIQEFIKEAEDLGMVVHMNTNGYLLSKELAKKLRNAGLSQVQINIDSLDPKKHDAIRGRKGSFKRAVQALKNAKEVGLTCVSQTVLSKQTEEEIFEIFNFARSLGIQRCRVWDITPSGRASENMDQIPANYVNTLRNLAELAYESGAINIESGEPLFPNNYKTELDVTGGFCIAMLGAFITISSTGDVFPCVTQRIPLYNIFKTSFDKDSLFNFHMSKLKELMQSGGVSNKCVKCESFEKCRGGCFTRRKYSPYNEDYLCTRLKNGLTTPICEKDVISVTA